MCLIDAIGHAQSAMALYIYMVGRSCPARNPFTDLNLWISLITLELHLDRPNRSDGLVRSIRAKVRTSEPVSGVSGHLPGVFRFFDLATNFGRQHPKIPKITPKLNRLSKVYLTRWEHEKVGSNRFANVGLDTISVETIPSEMDPRQISMVVKFVQKLQKKGSILSSEINDTQSTLFLGSAGMFPGNKISSLLCDISTMPKTMLSISINMLKDLRGYFKGTERKSKWKQWRLCGRIAWLIRVNKCYIYRLGSPSLT